MTVMLYGLTEIWIEMSPGDGNAADNTIYNFFLYNECHAIMVFRVFSVVLDLMSCICGSFSKPCPSDFSMAKDVPLIAF